jgi:hypothetical protein
MATPKMKKAAIAANQGMNQGDANKAFNKTPGLFAKLCAASPLR